MAKLGDKLNVDDDFDIIHSLMQTEVGTPEGKIRQKSLLYEFLQGMAEDFYLRGVQAQINHEENLKQQT